MDQMKIQHIKLITHVLLRKKFITVNTHIKRNERPQINNPNFLLKIRETEQAKPTDSRRNLT
jgi:hypothetical protein